MSWTKIRDFSHCPNKYELIENVRIPGRLGAEENRTCPYREKVVVEEEQLRGSRGYMLPPRNESLALGSTYCEERSRGQNSKESFQLESHLES